MTPRPKSRRLLAALWFLPVALMASGSAFAQLKIGYVAFEEILKNAPQVQIGKDRLEQQYASRYDAIEQQEKDLLALEEQLVRDRAVMSDERLQALERQIRNQRREVQRAKEDLYEETQASADVERQRLSEEIRRSVESFAKENGYDLILMGTVLYVEDSVDLTEEFLQRLREDAADDGAQ